ncbi:hypothetical protein GCM10027519_47340 [Kineococcus endophyticus]
MLKFANATNFPVTLSQWRAIHALVPLDDSVDDTLWNGILHWARRFVETVDLEEEEREYKVRAAELLGEARTALTHDGDWREPLLAAFKATNTLGWRIPLDVRA